MPTPDALAGLIGRQMRALGHADDPDVARLLAAIQARFGAHVRAVLLYGSYLRGKRDTLLDFYVLLDDLRALPPLEAAGNRLLPPNVYYLSLPAADGAPALRAKVATMTLTRFEQAMLDYHSYFWARFTQPTGLVRVRRPEDAARVAGALARAVHRFVASAAPTVPAAFDSATLWREGLTRTYACELRAEDPAGAADLYRRNAAHFDALLEAYAAEPYAAVRRNADGRYQTRATTTRVSGTGPAGWAVRRLQGKLLSVLRLVKAAATFDDPLDYLLWKIERHSGIYIAPTERQRRHPLIFAWPLLWRLYRRGAFR